MGQPVEARAMIPQRTPAWARGASLLQRQGALIALVGVALFGVLRYGETFYSSYNFWETLRNNSYFALIALGMAFVIMTGGIDLSVGSVVALSAVVAARLSPEGIYLATGAAMAAGLAVGVTNGLVIARFSVQPFIVTLASLLGARGMALLVAGNATVPVDFEHGFIDIGQREIGPVPLPVVLVVIAYALGSLLLNFTRFGRHVLALGGNEEAARLAGLPIGRILISVYAMSGMLAGLAGAILAGLAFSGPPTAALGWELSAIAAVVVGGTLLTGGMGSVGATLAGVLLIGLIFNVLNFERGRGVFNLTVYWENVIRGVFLLLVVLFQHRLTRALRLRS
ncbi:MAG TPA: ABC transporter permease [Thermomicrobiales bacterium]|nr:ABC transporter permease [Thermomicrobiales bacterium]